MALTTKYITKAEYADYFGEDLDEMFGDASAATAWLCRIEDRMESWLEANLFFKTSQRWPNMTDHQKECYKKALLEQAIYVFKNGDISVDSGYDPEGGISASKGDIRSRVIAPNAKDYLKNAGIWKQSIRRSGWSGVGFWGF